KGNELKKYDKVTLRNGGNDSQLHFRDAFIQDLAKDLAVDIMASEPYLLFINGEFWGFYMLREKPEDYYIQSHYGIDEKEVTVIKNGSLDSGEWEDLEEYRDFCRWASSTDMTWEPNFKKFCEQMDVQSFMDYMAIETYVNNSDWSTGYMNNWMVWRSEIKDSSLKNADGKWRFILYDMDISSGIWGSDVNSAYYDSLGTIGAEWADFNLPAILKNLCKNEEFKETFYQNYLSVIDNVFAYDKVEEKLNEYTSLCGEATKATQYRFGDGWAADGYDNNAKSLLRFFKVRPEYAKKYLDIYCGFKEADSGVTLTETRHLPPSKWWYWGGAEFRVDYEKEESMLTISVKNDYEVIPREKLKTLFDKFTRVDDSTTRTTRGTGLGLFIVKGLVEAMNGEIRLYSTEECGFCVKISMPISQMESGKLKVEN
ncbi:MAG: CotH kinase family protein, partial [Lachnospiraceae bacterium]|nr:CotH kinase family protein [Lachnospiraceae bacterium]